MSNCDKQIIFDDVEVKDCIAYAKSQTVYLGDTVYKQMEKVCMVKNQPCKFFDCQFKQMARELKAKEQECEELTSKCSQLKEENVGALKQLEFVRTLNTVQEAEIRKLSKTLTEIKEIAKNGCYDDCGMPLDELSIILQKISEVEND
jgi:predicted RNase H-like nuclease (RuvC/YqgF family)